MFFSFKKNSKMFKRVNHILKFVFKYLVNGTIYFKNPKKNKVIIFDSKYPGSFYLRYLFLKKITLTADEIQSFFQQESPIILC